MSQPVFGSNYSAIGEWKQYFHQAKCHQSPYLVHNIHLNKTQVSESLANITVDAMQLLKDMRNVLHAGANDKINTTI